MSDSLSNEKLQLIKAIAQHESITDYNLEVKSGSIKGDGYLGIINTIHVQEVNQPKKELHMILKSAMTGDKLRELTPVRQVYEREIYLYETVLPTLKHFSDENGIQNKFTEWAKCYGHLLTNKQECIMLEDLKQDGFQLWNRKIPMNQDHLAMVFASYAKFHGTSLALKYLQPEKFDELRSNLKNVLVSDSDDEETKRKVKINCDQAFANGFEAVGSDESAVQALTRFAENASKFFLEDVAKFDKYSTILHGDCWVNNMMFKYKDHDNALKPTGMCFLDWQLANVGSPIVDLSYFFYTSSSKGELQNLAKYLKIYYDNVTKTVEEAGVNVAELFTFEELEEQWKIYSKYGLFMTFFIFKVMLSEVEDAVDLSNCADGGKSLIEAVISTQSVNSDEVNKRIVDVVNFVVQHGYL